MRLKQRPVKSSKKGKSLTFIIDSHASFGDYDDDNEEGQDDNTATNNDILNDPLLRKQFAHNYRHMSDVMRLAFLENNDISIDDCSNIDFNSLSTASILHRNIQQQLQQERRDELQLRQQQQHSHLHQHQQQHHNTHYQNNSNNNLQHHQHQQQQQLNEILSLQRDLIDEYGNNDNYDVSDSSIFATATPNSSSGLDRTTALINATDAFLQQHHVGDSSRGKGCQSQHRGVTNSPNNKKRTKDTAPRVEFSNQVQVETIQNHGEGFLCDEPGCGKSFPSLRKLRHHKVVHSDDFPFVCEFNGCGKKFKRKFGIDLHSTTHFDLDPEMYSKTSNNSSLPFFGRRMQYSMCKPCGQKFKTVHEYQYHMVKHGKEPFKCPVKGCGQTFGIWKSFQKHRASHYFNYYCKMDPQCDHHTSNLQLLKLHIYCCHFRRTLPENATLASRDPAEEETSAGDTNEVVDVEEQSQQMAQPKNEPKQNSSQSMNETQQNSTDSTPRRDSRLRKNPPRSSTFGHQDYASINNGISFAKSIQSTPTLKRTRATISSGGSQASTGSQSVPPPEKKLKQPLKILPKRSAQRLPMSLIADDRSTEDEGHSSDQLQQHPNLHQHQQQHNNDYNQNNSDNNQQHDQHQQQQQLNEILSLQRDLVDEYGNNDYYDVSDSSIFATATPNSSSSLDRTAALINATGSFLQHQQAGDSSHEEECQSQRRGVTNSPNNKKRTKDTAPRVEFSNQVQVETMQNHGEGFLCDEPGCGKSFPSLRKLRHHKVVHSDDFPFVCEFNGCGKKFKRKFGIDLHSTTHFDLDPEMYSKTSNNSSLPFFGRRMQYSMCKPCGQKFKTVHEYQFHMLQHGKEPFKCPVKGCGQTFGIWKSFQKHRASHYFNYYCKMDPQCDHHTSNLQLLKLHIYCCHFRRTLPENATLASRDPAEEETSAGDTNEVVDVEEQSQQMVQPKEEPKQESSQSMNETQQNSTDSTPRRDSRLRKNPPRSSTFGHQDYASINNGISFAKSIQSTPTLKRTRATISSGGSQASTGSQSVPPPEKKLKQPLKILPKRSAQRLPMSLIADDRSTEDEGHSSEDEVYLDKGNEEDNDQDDSSKRNKFKCHLCEYKFSVKFQLTKHLSTHLDLGPDMYSATADKQVVQLSERRRREFYCDKCNLKFEHMPELDNHMRKHGQRPYVCNFCQHPSTFRLAKQYLSHLYEHRFNYKCTMTPDCDFTINRKDALKLHIFRMHLDQSLPSWYADFARLC